MNDTTHIRLVLVDDNPAVLRQVMQVLPDDFDILDTFESGAGLPAAVERHQPEVIVLDISLPGVNGITLARQLTAAGCSAKIVFLSVHDDSDYVRSAFAAGASGYVLKMRLSLDLEHALRTVIAGRQFVSPTLALDTD